ncbi:MinD/ParA family protein [Halobacillus sp. A5]|uniref:MinD/ParA family protein n=1 Tax=Halobacillus sp. A5 TaxID=2880263 RepID=UPI0020A66B77|nr:MinD/ParA family protein [Halobacillus sp. A5]MCP3026103.1 MinD/ParA family protein [Halobacillus sp. A5]
MSDQAEKLRSRLLNRRNVIPAKTIAVASGKGGVGKSNFTINFALKLIEYNKKVLIIDFDIGMGNVDILLGVSPHRSIVDLFSGSTSIGQIVEQGPGGLEYISGGSGLSEIFTLNNERADYFFKQFNELINTYDFILFDMGAGVSRDSLYFMASADEVIIVTTAEPTSITDAYGVIKHLVSYDSRLPIKVLLNRTLTKESGGVTFERLEQAALKFIKKKITFLGSLPDDHKVMKSVLAQVPFVTAEPDSKAAKAVQTITQRYLHLPVAPSNKSFLSKLKSFVKER